MQSTEEVKIIEGTKVIDERKKTIKTLEGEKKEFQESINVILVQLGEILVTRLANEESFSLSTKPSVS